MHARLCVHVYACMCMCLYVEARKQLLRVIPYWPGAYQQDQGSTGLCLASSGITSTHLDAGHFWTWVLGFLTHFQVHFCLSYPLPCPGVYVLAFERNCRNCHQTPGGLVRSEAVPWGSRWRQGCSSQLYSPAPTYKSNPKNRSKELVQRGD